MTAYEIGEDIRNDEQADPGMGVTVLCVHRISGTVQMDVRKTTQRVGGKACDGNDSCVPGFGDPRDLQGFGGFPGEGDNNQRLIDLDVLHDRSDKIVILQVDAFDSENQQHVFQVTGHGFAGTAADDVHSFGADNAASRFAKAIRIA